MPSLEGLARRKRVACACKFTQSGFKTTDVPETAPKLKKDFFISYNKADRKAAEWIAWQLEEEGHYSVAIQAWDFGPGSNFALEMNRASKDSARVLAVLSPDYLTSDFAASEWAAHFAQDPA